MYVYVSVLMWVHMHVSAHAYEGQSQYQVSFSVTPPPLEAGFLTVPRMHWFSWADWPVSSRYPPISIFPVMGL